MVLSGEICQQTIGCGDFVAIEASSETEYLLNSRKHKRDLDGEVRKEDHNQVINREHIQVEAKESSMFTFATGKMYSRRIPSGVHLAGDRHEFSNCCQDLTDKPSLTKLLGISNMKVTGS